jgi:hypothetical protein
MYHNHAWGLGVAYSIGKALYMMLLKKAASLKTSFY